MAEKKKQHFVPQFYLKNFSVDAGRKRVSLYVIDTDKLVPEATIKDQAFENYFYGKAGMEDELSILETLASPIIAKAIADNTLPERMSEGHLALLTFVLFQDARTPVMAAQMNEHTEKLARRFARDIPDLKDEADGIRVNDRDAPVKALRMKSEIRDFALDLRWKLLENKTRRLFITSDNPAVRYNQFLEKRNTLGSNIGIDCKGLQIFLPLGPRHMLMLYDGDVYRVGGRKHLENHIEGVREADVEALNVLGVANADGMVYFSADTDIAHVREAVERAKGHRQAEKVDIKEHRGIGPGGERGTLIQTSPVGVRIGLTLDFSVILPSAAGPHLNAHTVQLRHPELVRRFEESRMRGGPFDARRFVESFLGR
jgi:hypothetical protein